MSSFGSESTLSRLLPAAVYMDSKAAATARIKTQIIAAQRQNETSGDILNQFPHCSVDRSRTVNFWDSHSQVLLHDMVPITVSLFIQ